MLEKRKKEKRNEEKNGKGEAERMSEKMTVSLPSYGHPQIQHWVLMEADDEVEMRHFFPRRNVKARLHFGIKGGT